MRSALVTSWRDARTRLAACALIIILVASIPAANSAPAESPDVSAVAQRAMVVSESEQATAAGVEILRRGGNAVDAACATALALGITNPAASGIGGGGFMLIYMAATKQVYALDYRERAPLKASPTMFVRDGHPNEALAQNGILAVATPGEIAGIDAALRRFGVMKFQTVAAPAIKLARDGFPASPHLAGEIAHFAPKLAADPGLREVFLKPDGTAPKAGDTIVAKNLAVTLESLGNDPAANFYRGPIAATIAAFMTAQGGILSTTDLAEFRPNWRDPLHRGYESYQVYTMPPPSSGGVLLEMLGMLEGGELGALGVDSPPYLARLIEVMRQGFEDRALYGDPSYVNVPLYKLLSPEHVNELHERALHRKSPSATPAAHDHGTSNLLVVDNLGNLVALTTTINTPFGAKVTVPKLGILLNDEMDDFAVAQGVENAYRLEGEAANLIAPGKRPLSSMTPIIVMKDGKPIMTAGGSGGPTILSGVLQVTLNILDSHLSAARAVAEPRIHEQASPDVVIVEQSMPAATQKELAQMGYKLRVVPNLGAVSAITIEPGNIRGAYDPRKGGAAAGY
ncbi:MAG TPA: gamma-glutamyltransferase [Candidatus Binataceae bacterium]